MALTINAKCASLGPPTMLFHGSRRSALLRCGPAHRERYERESGTSERTDGSQGWRGLALSPDGRHLVFETGDNEILVYAVPEFPRAAKSWQGVGPIISIKDTRAMVRDLFRVVSLC